MASVTIAPNLRMPLLGFGTYKLTGSAPVKSALDAALKVGYRFIDTAQFYDNEADIGSSLKELLPKYGLKREDLFLTTKVAPSNMRPEDLYRSVKDSVSKLQSDFLDLCFIHYPKASGKENKDPENKTIRAEAWKAMEKCQAEGLTKAIGISNYEVKHMKEMEEYATIWPAINQTEFHPHFTRNEVRNYCKEKHIHFQAYTSLARNNPKLMGSEILRTIAEKHGATPAQILIAFPLCQGISALPKSADPERVASNFESQNIRLSEEEITQLMALNQNHHYTLCTPWEVE